MAGFRRVYGSHPLHLLTLVAGLALFGYVVAMLGVSALWNPRTWWQSIVVWFAAAVIGHDLVLYPLYTLADRVLALSERIPVPVPLLNHLRVPALGAALTFLVFSPASSDRVGAPTPRPPASRRNRSSAGGCCWSPRCSRSARRCTRPGSR